MYKYHIGAMGVNVIYNKTYILHIIIEIAS
jgi:hypothetical protein